MSAMPTLDRLSRPLRSLRLSVTDRCNMRCRYCMPEAEYVWLPRTSILRYEEMDRLTGVFVGLGVSKLRLTGGEPLLRHDLARLVALLGARPGVQDLALTTNGLLLAGAAPELRAAGLKRITVSLDTLRPERLEQFARSRGHAEILAGIQAAIAAGFPPPKLNAVIIRGFNDDEVEALLEFGRREGCEVRYIEYMDVGGANAWRMDDVVSRQEILERLGRRFGPITPLQAAPGDSRPAEEFTLGDGTRFGIIASTTEPFCRSCDRGRLTADGFFYRCLYAAQGIDLRTPLRDGATDAELAALVRTAWEERTDRGAEVRLGLRDRGALYQVGTLRADPHKEMHTRGG